MNNESLNTTNKLIKPEEISPSDDAIIRQLSDNLQNITPEDVNSMCDEMDEAKKMEEKKIAKRKNEEKKLKNIESMKGNKDLILEDLRNNYLTFEDGVKVMGYRGKRMHLELPAIGNFGGYKFDCFISNRRYKFRSKLSEKTYSIMEIGKLLESLNNYLKELGVEIDGNINYEKYLQNSLLKKDEYIICNALECLKEITGLSDFYWIANKTSRGALDSVKLLDYYKTDCCFYWEPINDDVACFLLNISE